ncbi:thioredoxin family protein [Luteolibacter pohnpeiensis]|uniref:Thioredoxin family protein n=1 Tax=Luteolibacter pohnpeiensis TaxID=454153 RepID=A0A934SCG6_9BACT|nr:thioredoxin family protein [Luteolibacter pohnpeiensis]MBK1882723.1 thioredoxin family protein [Luteolibacter pohnpeiensis]
MKAITWLAALTVGMAAVTTTSCSENQSVATSNAEWGTNIDTAVKLAKAENKSVLVEFTGSDWCPPCIMMHKEVFSKDEFLNEASKNFVLVKIDLPHSDPELTEANQPVVEKYKIDGFPSVLLLDSEGKEFGRFYASDYPKTDQFLAHLDKILTLHQPN